MSMPPDKPEHDPHLAAAWHETSDELPPPPLDSTILAAAHRAVGSGPRDAGNPDAAVRDARRWRIPLAAAASICVVALGVLLTRPELPVVSTMSVSAPPSTSPPASAPVIAQAPARRDEAAPAVDSASPPATLAAAKKRSSELREYAAAPAARAAQEAVAPLPVVADKAELFKQSESRVSANAIGNLADQDSARGAAGVAAPVDAAAAIAHIRQLHQQGKLAQAAQALRALRAATPEADQQLPVELRAWAATVNP